MNKIAYFRAPADWNHEGENPFIPDGSYGPGWSCFRIMESRWEPYGRTDKGLYFVSTRPDSPILKRRLADFLRYEAGYGRSVIVACPTGFEVDTLVADALEETPTGSKPRLDDPRWLIHSTPLEAWARIQADGELRSLQTLRQAGVNIGGIGFRDFGEPSDYADYVMLNALDGIGPEHVVASWHKGEVITEEDTPYEPGARLYFDGRRILQDGLIVRDGLHSHKVWQRLPLEPYLSAAVTAADVNPQSKIDRWTPKTFHTAANDYFRQRFGDK